MRNWLAAVLMGVSMMAGVRPVDAQAIARYAVILVVDAGDNPSKIQELVGGFLARLSGRDEDPFEAGRFDRFVMADTAPERDVRIYFGYEETIGDQLVAIAEQLPGVITLQTQFGAPINRDQMTHALLVRAWNDGYTHAWTLRQQSRTDGLILQNFAAIQRP